MVVSAGSYNLHQIAPERLGNLFSFAAEAHVFAGFSFQNSFGVQTMSTLAVEYRATLPFALRADLGHLAMSFTSPTNIAAVDASAGASKRSLRSRFRCRDTRGS